MDLFSLKIDDINKEALLAGLNFEKFSFVVTPNVQHVVELNENQFLRSVYESADFTLCDSKVLQLISVFLKRRIRNVVAGSDLTEYIFSSGFLKNKKVMIVGPEADDVEVLSDRFDLQGLCSYSPPMGFIDVPEEVDKTLMEIESYKPNILFLALGFPRQEIIASLLKKRSRFNCASFCVGASIDFLTGKQVRAPIFMRKIRMEWAYRLFSNPLRLFQRYFYDFFKLIPIVFCERRKIVRKK